MNALTSATLLASTSISPAHGDAELIRVCDAHAGKIADANAGDKPDDHPAWLAYFGSVEFINDTKATTLAGLLAKARAAKAEASTFYSESDEEHWENCPAENWAPDVCNELLELFGSSPVSPDADLIEACHQYLTVQREFEAYYITLDGNMEDTDPHWAILDPLPGLRDKIATLRATTPEGYYARARCVAFHFLPSYKGCCDDPSAGGEDRFNAANLRDLVQEERGAAGAHAVTPYVSPDAELLQACEEFDELERAYLATGFGHAIGSPEDAGAEAEQDRLSVSQRALVARMCEMRAVTREGMAARVRSYALWDAELMKPQGDIEGLFTQAIVRDLLAGSAGA